MTRDDIARMASESCRAGTDGWLHSMAVKQPQVLERFAALVAAAEREVISDLLGGHAIPTRTLIEIRADLNLRGKQ